MSKIIVADDEQRIVELISDFLTEADFTVIPAYSGMEAITQFDKNPDTDLIILDIMMPEMNGWEALKEIRKKSFVPVIMLSARSEEFDMLNSFENGADEYVTKPFSPAVLVKRAEALIKRNEQKSKSENENDKGLKINKESYSAFLDGKELSLSAKEFELLSYLYENKGRVISRDSLLDAIWGYDYCGDTRTVDSHIAKLRQSLKEYGASHLKTVYGFGYKLEV